MKKRCYALLLLLVLLIGLVGAVPVSAKFKIPIYNITITKGDSFLLYKLAKKTCKIYNLDGSILSNIKKTKKDKVKFSLSNKDVIKLSDNMVVAIDIGSSTISVKLNKKTKCKINTIVVEKEEVDEIPYVAADEVPILPDTDDYTVLDSYRLNDTNRGTFFVYRVLAKNTCTATYTLNVYDYITLPGKKYFDESNSISVFMEKNNEYLLALRTRYSYGNYQYVFIQSQTSYLPTSDSQFSVKDSVIGTESVNSQLYPFLELTVDKTIHYSGFNFLVIGYRDNELVYADYLSGIEYGSDTNKLTFKPYSDADTLYIYYYKGRFPDKDSVLSYLGSFSLDEN